MKWPGFDWCRVLPGAQMWPVGQPAEAVPVHEPNGGPPIGCVCFNDDEQQILQDRVPAEHAALLEASIEQAARNRCSALAPAGFDHNCYLDGPGDPQPETPFDGDPGECVGDCVYTHDCGDPDPYECEELLADKAGGEGETGGADGPLAAGTHIHCSGTDCEIDEGFATSLWRDPSPLLEESTRLIYDSSAARFRFEAVGPGTVADELGFDDGDVLESVNGVIIDDLDAALALHAQSGEVDSLRVRVARGSRWLDFHFTFVP